MCETYYEMTYVQVLSTRLGNTRILCIVNYSAVFSYIGMYKKHQKSFFFLFLVFG